jgi:hypothetical protein
MEPTIGAKRVSTVRRFGWLGVASMLALALLAPAASVAAALVTPTYPAGNPTCTELDPAWTLSFKIDTGDLENRAYDWDEGGDVESNWNGQTITLSGWSAEGQTFNWSSALPVNGVLIKGGNNNALYTYVPAGSGDTGLTHGPGQQAISHLLFCGDPTPPPTDPPVTAPPVTAPPVTAPPVTAPPVTAPPSQQVLAVTGAPIVTLPPTDSLGGTAGPSDGSWRLALMAMAALLASVLVLTPAKATNRRR